MAGIGWSSDETQALIEIWSDEQVQAKLRKNGKTKPIFEKIAEKLRQLGYNKSATQCHTKIKNLIARYRKVKDNNRKSGSEGNTSFIYFDDIDSVLGTRAASEPPVLMDSGIGSSIVDISEGKFHFWSNIQSCLLQ